MALSRRIILLAYFAIIILVIALAYFVVIPQLTNTVHLADTPVPLYQCSLSVLNPQVTEVPGYNSFYDNVSQGMSLKVNLTFNSTTNQPITIPIENLTVSYYSNTVNLHSWVNNGEYYSIQQQAFNYSFSQKQLTIQPFMSNSTILTINLAQNAPIGQYSILIYFGDVKATNIISYGQTNGLELVVTPRTT